MADRAILYGSHVLSTPVPTCNKQLLAAISSNRKMINSGKGGGSGSICQPRKRQPRIGIVRGVNHVGAPREPHTPYVMARLVSGDGEIRRVLRQRLGIVQALYNNAA